MRHGHGPSGGTGLTMDANQMKIWSLSVGVFSDLTGQVKIMGGSDK